MSLKTPFTNTPPIQSRPQKKHSRLKKGIIHTLLALTVLITGGIVLEGIAHALLLNEEHHGVVTEWDATGTSTKGSRYSSIAFKPIYRYVIEEDVTRKKITVESTNKIHKDGERVVVYTYPGRTDGQFNVGLGIFFTPDQGQRPRANLFLLSSVICLMATLLWIAYARANRQFAKH